MIGLLPRNRAPASLMVSAVLIALISGSPELSAQTAAGTGRVHGIVFDSLDHRPLGGALVQIAEVAPGRGAYSVTSDSLGRFQIDSVHAGSYIAGFLHPLLDSIGISTPNASITVDDGATVTLALAVPSLKRLTVAICGNSGAPGKTARAGTDDSLGIIVGHVRDASTGAAIPGVPVTLVWRTLVFGSGGAHTEERSLRATTMDEGWFAMCGLVVDDYEVHAEHARQGTGLIDIPIHPHDLVRLSLLLGSDTAVASADSTRRGGATITGTVMTRDKRPLEGAQVAVDGSTASATTDARGTFRLTGVPDGTRMAEARALGYEPVRMRVEPSRAEEQALSFVMEKHVATLDAVTVYGKRGTRFRDVTGFLERKHRGFGRFVTQQEIEQENVTSACELLRRVPGVNVRDAGLAGCTANIRAATTAMRLCEPTIYQDNIPFSGTISEFSQSVAPRDIMGIEVYSNATEPPQFQGACGVIVVWTKSGA